MRVGCRTVFKTVIKLFSLDQMEKYFFLTLPVTANNVHYYLLAGRHSRLYEGRNVPDVKAF